ncbi:MULTISPECIES: hypothetical protein [Streptomyces]|nr:MULTISPECIES: hypothetical protein [Streptomyces]
MPTTWTPPSPAKTLGWTSPTVFRGERGTVFVLHMCHSLAGEDIPSGLPP